MKKSELLNIIKEEIKNILSEASYVQYKKDESGSPKQKVNSAIHQINSKLFEIEKIVRQNIKLKQESGVNNEQYWESTKGKLKRIKERMMNIAWQMNRLGDQ